MAGVLETVLCEPPKLPRVVRGSINVTSPLPPTPPFPNLISPLRALRLPARVRRWLSDAGITICSLEASAVRRGMAPERQRRPFLLFDSGDASGRVDAEAAAALGFRTIDVARLLAAHYLLDEPDHTVAAPGGPRRRFLERLRKEIETLGGTWLRLADFPHPYRGVLCVGTDQEGADRILSNLAQEGLRESLAEIPTGGRMRGQIASNQLFRLYRAAGRPMWLSGLPVGQELPTRLRGEIDLLTWVTDLETFASWWRWRRRAKLLARRDKYTIELATETPQQSGTPPGPWDLAVEIWRGRHRALLPVPIQGMTIDERLLPFQREDQRHDAGFLVDEPDLGPSSPPIPLMGIAS